MDIVQEVKDGNVDALKAFVELKRKEKEVKAALSEIKDLALEEAAKYGAKTFDAFGVVVEMRSGGGRWDYKHLDWWPEFQTKQEEAKQAFKASSTMIQDGGVVVQPAKYLPNAETFAVKL